MRALALATPTLKPLAISAPALAKFAQKLLAISDVTVRAEVKIAASADRHALTRTAESLARVPAIWLPLATNATTNILLAENAPVTAAFIFGRLPLTTPIPAQTKQLTVFMEADKDDTTAPLALETKRAVAPMNEPEMIETILEAEMDAPSDRNRPQPCNRDMAVCAIAPGSA